MFLDREDCYPVCCFSVKKEMIWSSVMELRMRIYSSFSDKCSKILFIRVIVSKHAGFTAIRENLEIREFEFKSGK